MGVPVKEPKDSLVYETESLSVLLVAHSDSIRRQLGAYGISNIYNLRNLSEKSIIDLGKCNLPYHFTNRSKNKDYLCYVLSGCEFQLWKNTLGRIKAFQSKKVDYCVVSSRKYSDVLEKIAERNGWSYLYTKQNQVCYIRNLVIDFHFRVKSIFKIDEDIFIGKDFFPQMIQEFDNIEKIGEYGIGFVVPVIPVNCCGHVSYLKVIEKGRL